MFHGLYHATFEEKEHRFKLPKELADQVYDRELEFLILTFWHSGALVLLPVPAWKKLQKALLNEFGDDPLSKSKVHRLFISPATMVPVQAHGKIPLPQGFVRIWKKQPENDIILIGMPYGIEVWQRQSFETWQNQSRIDIDPAAEALLHKILGSWNTEISNVLTE